MARRDHHSATSAGPVQGSRRQASEARTELALDGLSHQQQRALRAALRAGEDASRRRRRRLRRLSIAATGAIVAMAITALSFGLVPAIEAASGGGTTGSFVVSDQVCSAKTGCQWVGTFRAGDGTVFSGLAYSGSLPSGDGTGSVIPARYPGGSDQVYALHGSHTWVLDLFIVLAIGAAVGAALWISPLGAGARNPEGVHRSA
ncbi:MAG TPA: hypothetical protein VMA72_11500 [Streptosporangiaceae bacterium]|nr:hypothetical protein [Streptosporangiaceae bacterium]